MGARREHASTHVSIWSSSMKHSNTYSDICLKEASRHIELASTYNGDARSAIVWRRFHLESSVKMARAALESDKKQRRGNKVVSIFAHLRKVNL